jgi:hypothetical protein
MILINYLMKIIILEVEFLLLSSKTMNPFSGANPKFAFGTAP